MEGENKFEPNEIPNMVALLCDLFSQRAQPNAINNAKINSFYMRYMGKAMDDCQAASSAHWQVARKQSDVALNDKVVKIEGEPGYFTEFVVVTTACLASNLDQFNEFKHNSQEAILDKYADDTEFVTIYNKMAFNGSRELATGKRTLVRGLWIACRLSRNHFEAVDKQEDTVH